MNPPNAAAKSAVVAHGPDWRCVRWGNDPATGEPLTFTFTPTQAAIIRVLWDAYAQGTPDVGALCLLERADSAGVNSRRASSFLAGLFVRHAAWKRLIIKGAMVGTYRLAEPVGGPP